MHKMGEQMHGLGANEPTCTPLAMPLVRTIVLLFVLLIPELCIKFGDLLAK